jgi:hypothetical protein
MKKRKLNSNNPRYIKNTEEVKTRKEFVHEVKGVKVYKLYYV